MSCALCHRDHDLSACDNPPLQLCAHCRQKLTSHICVICSGCNTAYWLPKTPANVVQAAEMSGKGIDEIMDNAILHLVPACRRCPSHGLHQFVSLH